MVIDALFGIILAVIGALVSALPTFTAPDTTGWFSGAHDIALYLRIVNHWVNVPLAIALVGTLATLLAAYGVVKGLLFVYDRLPGKGS